MEIEFFCKEDESDEWMEYWIQKRLDWYKDLGLKDNHCTKLYRNN